MQKKISTIRKSLVCGGEVSLAVLDTTAVVDEAIVRHALSPVAAAALGRALTATAYLCSWLKDENSSLSVSVDGGGAGGKLGTAGDGSLCVRGFIEHPDVSLPPRADGKLDVRSCVGTEGTLTVIRDDGDGIPFAGTSRLVSGELAEDFSAYFLTSEQRPTAIALGVLVGTDGRCAGAGGVFLQPLPGAGEEAISFCEREIARFSRVSAMIAEGGAENIMKGFGEEAVSVRDIFFRCRCSREKAEGLVLSLGKDEALSAAREEGGVTVTCQYCNTAYTFSEAEVCRLFGEEA